MTDKTPISTRFAPEAIGPYSQAIRAGGLVFTAGQIAIDPASGHLAPGGIEEETRQVLENLTVVLEAAGCTLADVVKTTVFLADMGEFATMNEVYGRFFSEPYPARSTVQAAKLPKSVRVEIDAVAVVPDGR